MSTLSLIREFAAKYADTVEFKAFFGESIERCRDSSLFVWITGSQKLGEFAEFCESKLSKTISAR